MVVAVAAGSIFSERIFAAEEVFSPAAATETFTVQVFAVPSSAVTVNFCAELQSVTETGFGDTVAPSLTEKESTAAEAMSVPAFSLTVIVPADSSRAFENGFLKMTNKFLAEFLTAVTETIQIFCVPSSAVTVNFFAELQSFTDEGAGEIVAPSAKIAVSSVHLERSVPI